MRKLILLGALFALTASPALANCDTDPASCGGYAAWVRGHQQSAPVLMPAPAASDRSTVVDPYKPTWQQQQMSNPALNGPAPGATSQETIAHTADGGITHIVTRAAPTTVDVIDHVAGWAILGLLASHNNGYYYGGGGYYGNATMGGRGAPPQSCGYYCR